MVEACGAGDAWEDTTITNALNFVSAETKREESGSTTNVAKKDLLPLLVADCLIVMRVFSSPRTMHSKSKDSFSNRNRFVSSSLILESVHSLSQKEGKKSKESLLGTTKHAKNHINPILPIAGKEVLAAWEEWAGRTKLRMRFQRERNWPCAACQCLSQITGY